MGYVAIENENSTPIERAGGISLAAVLGGTLLRWGRGTRDTPPRRVALRP